MKRASAARIALAWAPAVSYMALIWALSSMALPDVPIDRFPFRDKGVHAVEYAVLAFLVTHAALLTWPDRARSRIAALALLVTSGWGVLDEIHQAFVPGRSSDLLDLVADLVGALVGSGTRLGIALLRARSSAAASSLEERA